MLCKEKYKNYVLRKKKGLHPFFINFVNNLILFQLSSVTYEKVKTH